MMSDWEFKSMNEEIKPLAADLRMKLNDLEAGKKSIQILPQIQLLITQLKPYQENRDWLTTYLKEVESSLAPMQEAYDRYKKNLRMFYVILGVLALAPLAALLMKADMTLILLLALPVPAWYLLGIRAYKRRFNFETH